MTLKPKVVIIRGAGFGLQPTEQKFGDDATECLKYCDGFHQVVRKDVIVALEIENLIEQWKEQIQQYAPGASIGIIKNN